MPLPQALWRPAGSQGLAEGFSEGTVDDPSSWGRQGVLQGFNSSSQLQMGLPLEHRIEQSKSQMALRTASCEHRDTSG